MSFSDFHVFIHTTIARIPSDHWLVMAIISLALIVFLLIRKSCSVYSSICLGITVFVGLFLLETTVAIRYVGRMHHSTGIDFGIHLLRRFHGSSQGRIETISNVVAFAPFGLFLSGFLASTKRFDARRRIGLATLAGFVLSLCIECLQLLLKVGYFELTDLVMNTLGAFGGACLATLGRELISRMRSRMI